MKKHFLFLLFLFIGIQEVSASSKENIDNKIFYIQSLIDENSVLSFDDKLIRNSSNIYIYKNKNLNSQKWIVKHDTNGYYDIISVANSQKVLDVEYGKTINKTNIQLYEKNNTSAQKWYLEEVSNGVYYIKSNLNTSKCLDIRNGSIVDGNNIQLYDCNGTKAQKWILKEYKENVNANIYKIRNFKYSNFVIGLENNSLYNKLNVQLSSDENKDIQKWKIIENSDGTSSVLAFSNLKYYFDVNGGSKKNMTNIQLYTGNNTFAQKWYFVREKDNAFSIRSALDVTKCVDIKNGNIISGNNIQLYDCNGTNAQLWKLEQNNLILESGTYNIKSSLNENYEINYYIKDNNILIKNHSENNSNIWNIKQENDYYIFASEMNSSLVFDLFNGQISNKTNVYLNKSNTINSQKWLIVDEGENYFSIRSLINKNKCLDVRNGSIVDGNNIQLYDCNGTKAQKWSIEKRDVDKYVPQKDSNSNFTNLVVFVKFKDDKRDIYNASHDYTSYQKYNWNDIKDMFNEDIQYTGYDDSFKKYISIVTNDKVRVNNVFIQQSIDGNSVNTFTLSGNQSDYSSGDSIIGEVIDALNDGRINNSFGNVKYDNVNSGIIDNLMIVVQGDAKGSNSVSENVLVNHKSDYGGAKKVNNLRVSKYVILNSDSLVTEDATTSTKSSAGVISHEFLHVLGLPDLYRSNGAGIPIGIYDIMASVSYFKQYPLSYLRARQGWINSNTISSSGTYTLNAVSTSNDKIVYRIKTPLSDSEEIVLEYRKKESKFGMIDYGLPNSGLLVYRVDTKVKDLTNVAGKNYIYIFRPNVTTQEGGTDSTYSYNGHLVNNIYDALIDPDKGENSYGSTDLSKRYTDDTIYYSDGSNSGIKISNIKYSSDKNSITFDIDFADYSQNDIWEGLGSINEQSNTEKNTLLVNSNKNVVTTFSNTNNKVVTKKYDNNSWVDIGNKVTGSSPSVVDYNGVYYLVARNNAGNVDFYKLNNNTWELIRTYNCKYAQYFDLVVGENNLYVWYTDTSTLVIEDAINNKEISSKTFSYLSVPQMMYYNNELYLAYSDFFASDKKGKLIAYNLSSKTWNTKYETNINGSNIHSFAYYNNELYAMFALVGNKPLIVKCNTTSCNLNNTVDITSYSEVDFTVNSKGIYVIYNYNNENNTSKSKTNLLKLKDNEYTLINDNLGLGLSHIKLLSYNDFFYIIYNISKDIYVKEKIISD